MIPCVNGQRASRNTVRTSLWHAKLMFYPTFLISKIRILDIRNPGSNISFACHTSSLPSAYWLTYCWKTLHRWVWLNMLYICSLTCVATHFGHAFWTSTKHLLLTTARNKNPVKLKCEFSVMLRSAVVQIVFAVNQPDEDDFTGLSHSITSWEKVAPVNTTNIHWSVVLPKQTEPKSLIFTRNKSGPKIEPRGTPLTITQCVLLVKKKMS